jgi:hypothetical protein
MVKILETLKNLEFVDDDNIRIKEEENIISFKLFKLFKLFKPFNTFQERNNGNL